MDIHLNELIIEEGYDKILLNSVSFRNIDQEFIIVHTEDSYGSLIRNNLYYCFIKPYEGLYFRLIGISDEEDNALKVDENMAKIEDISYDAIKDAVISKIIENGDLISNQLIVNMTFDYYNSNDDFKDLMDTRRITWIDEKRVPGNPDWIQIKREGDIIDLQLMKCVDSGVIAKKKSGQKYIFTSDGNVSDYKEY